MLSMNSDYPLIKLIQVDDFVYLYSAKSNVLLELGEADIVLDKNTKKIKSSMWSQLEESELVKKGKFKQVTPNYNKLDDFVEYQLSSYFPRKFTIEVTENCNLKCKYCLFAKINDSIVRKHSFRNMDINIAKKAIDYYFELYTSFLLRVPENKRQKLIEVCPPKISWWGGEPFLGFDIIKQSKEYFSSLNWSYFGISPDKLVFIVVTNLTIMNPEIENFLISNDVLLHISIDGGQKEHDANRVFTNNEGTFNTVLKNLKILIEKYPDYAKRRIIAQAVWAENIDIHKSYKFMLGEFKINTKEKQIANFVVYNQKKEKQILSSKQMSLDEKQELELFYKLLNQLELKPETEIIESLKFDLLAQQEFENLFLLERKLKFDNPQNIDYMSEVFSCPIGSDTIFVSVNGDFHMCMKYDYSFPLGNVFKGIDKNKIVQLYKNHIKGFKQKCKGCWAINFCKVCPAQTLYQNNFCFPTDKECCAMQQMALLSIKKYILLSRKVKIYNVVKEIFGTSNNKYIMDTGPININILNL